MSQLKWYVISDECTWEFDTQDDAESHFHSVRMTVVETRPILVYGLFENIRSHVPDACDGERVVSVAT